MSAEQPSSLAINHEREIVALKTGFAAFSERMDGVESWARKIESGMETLANEMRQGFNRFNQRNPSLYVAMGMFALAVLGMAAGVTLFAISSMIAPIRENILFHDRLLERFEEQRQQDHDMLIRLDERMKMKDKLSDV